MKQYITSEQFGELSVAAKGRLMQWVSEATGQGIEFELHRVRENFDPFFPLLSIGQLIEFLDEYGDLTNAEYGYKYVHWNEYWGESLLGNLWEAVKQVLEEEKITGEERGVTIE